MTRRVFLLVPAAAAWAQKKPQKKPDVEILKIASVRQEGKIRYEGDLKVTGERPITGLVIQLDFFESRKVLLTQQKIEIEEGTLNPGEGRHFSVEGNDVPRAVSFKVSAVDRTGRDLNVAGTGPYLLD
ncbi:MAG: hypothetical protein HY238_05425 [Acidobacteria bacterium]|nr:hypothetical protein [Acidobacteriota bacterium]